MPSISVVIPTYNRAQNLIKALSSVSQQTYQPVEIIVVDDGSTDETESVVRSFRSELNKTSTTVEFIQHNTNKGPAAARNTGIEHATGDFVAFLDSDDWWLDQKLELQMQLLVDSSPDTAVIYCEYYRQDEKNYRRKPNSQCYSGDVHEQLLQGWCPATTSLFLIRREALSDVGGFETGVMSFEDYDLWLRLAETYNFDYYPEPLVVKRVNGDDQLSSGGSVRRHNLNAFLNKWGDQMAAVDPSAPRRFKRQHIRNIAWDKTMEALDSGDRIDSIRQFKQYCQYGSPPLRRIGEYAIFFFGGQRIHSNIRSMYKKFAWESVTTQDDNDRCLY
jgi:glycosyltransferase involved in cell wall biosynthesis